MSKTHTVILQLHSKGCLLTLRAQINESLRGNVNAERLFAGAAVVITALHR